NFVARGLALLRQGREWTAAEDEIVAPTYLPDLVQASLDLLIDGETGVWHLTNGEALTWTEFARRAAALAGLDASLVRGVPARQFDRATREPGQHPPAGQGRGMLPSLADALARYQVDHEPIPAPVPPLRALVAA
ncbi:MAG: sugar nucleotide-binding protein, partial [Vitreoscilla sp.]